MKPLLLKTLRPTIALLSLAALAHFASAQASTTSPPPMANWPTQAVKIVVGFPGGSSPDFTARLLADPLSKALGQPVIVENKAGASGNIGANAVAKATDNHTIGLMINGNLTIAKLLNPKLTYDPLKELAPISLVATAPLILVAPAKTIPTNPSEFFAAAKAANDQWNYGSPGIGTIAHIGMELLKDQAKIQPLHIPYAGNPHVITALIGEQLQLAFLPPGLASEQIKAGRLTAIAVSSAQRSPLFPTLPTLAESGISDFNLEYWNAIVAPASMPLAVQAYLSKLIQEIIATPEIQAKLLQQGWQPLGSDQQVLASKIKQEAQNLGKIISQQKITIQ